MRLHDREVGVQLRVLAVDGEIRRGRRQGQGREDARAELAEIVVTFVRPLQIPCRVALYPFCFQLMECSEMRCGSRAFLLPYIFNKFRHVARHLRAPQSSRPLSATLSSHSGQN